MIKFKRLTIALAALFIASATAWADGTLLTTITASADFHSGSKTFDNIATVTLDGNFSGTTTWDGTGTITVTPAAGVTITSVKFISGNLSNGKIEDTTAPFQAVQAYDSNVSHIRYDVDGVKGDYEVSSIEVYGTAGTPLDLTEVTPGKQWKIETMPAGNVTLNVEYAPEFTATFKALTANTIQAGKATVTLTDNTEGATPQSKTPDADGKLTPVYEGQTITLTAAQGYKFRTVTAKKGGAAAGITNPEVGQVIGSDGKNYNVADVPTGVEKVAMIAYVNGSNGLAIALADESEKKDWATAITTAAAHTPTITGVTWKLPTKDEWNQMFDYSDIEGYTYTSLNNYLAAAGGDNSKFKVDNDYWTSSESDSGSAYLLTISQSNAVLITMQKSFTSRVRAVFAF